MVHIKTNGFLRHLRFEIPVRLVKPELRLQLNNPLLDLQKRYKVGYFNQSSIIYSITLLLYLFIAACLYSRAGPGHEIEWKSPWRRSCFKASAMGMGTFDVT